MDSYILGILWGTGSHVPSDGIVWIRHRDPFYPQVVAEYFGKNTHMSSSRTGDQYRLKLPEKYALDYLLQCGWTPRNADVRPYPTCEIGHAKFCRAWVELHGVLDWVKRKGKVFRRLRI